MLSSLKRRRDPHSLLKCYLGKEEKESFSRRKGSLCSLWKYLNEALGIFFPLSFPKVLYFTQLDPIVEGELSGPPNTKHH